MIGRRALNALLDNAYSTATQLMTNAVYAYYNDDLHQPDFFSTNNLALPVDYFRALFFEASLVLSHAAYTARFWWERVHRTNRRSTG